ncbi:hypothetical protein [Mycobacterium sp. AZCC_0083]|uniref:hypothetical protein n=1 Tax=Mycobacterium sp. AZCC_0083 TaxID=2735882 RepID=UPI00162062A4|nr:hypothetical protein [Mycobacterium sp. AZCC_0083]MBB5167081.1 hypothetical protein [Mycobacterium sp. AZCC_0083]
MSNYGTMVVWSGVSELDGVTPIVVLASFESSNVKTGNMIQTWILRSDVAPNVAITEGTDSAVCGSCVHRGDKSTGRKRTCYVNPRTPASVWRAFNRGNARPFDAAPFKGRKVRIGAYGDPAAAPFEVWARIAELATSVTGYTHQWRTCDPRFAKLTMASADSMDDYRVARRMGYRAFVVRELGAAKPQGLVQCPATEGKSNTVQCIDCMQCGGTDNGRKASISIEVHGATARAFKALPLAVI